MKAHSPSIQTKAEATIILSGVFYNKKDILGFLEYLELSEKRGARLIKEMNDSIFSKGEEKPAPSTSEKD